MSKGISNFYLVVYRDNKTNKLSRIEQYEYDKWGGFSNSATDIDSYKYGYNSKIIKPIELIQENARLREGLEKIKENTKDYCCYEHYQEGFKICNKCCFASECSYNLATEALQQKGEDEK